MTGSFSYDATVTDEEFRIALGQQLLLRLHAKGLKPFDITKRGGPNYATVQAMNRGEMGRWSSIEDYAALLDTSVVELIRMILQPSATALSPEAFQIVSKYERTTVAGRQALLSTAQALPLAGPEAHPEPLSGPQESLTDRPERSTPRLVNNGKRRK